ncbi:beta-phosphoglucomutase family hydrolase [Streptomyces halstedii]|uniref:beta-phosphoglucomutase family hydrolase n=1 Tax=Streptomyces TaxID=1883 RepID=UPI00048FF9B8|nr:MULTISPECIES: beta-phosphoglucomutase family hydrolase [Streptomyces]MYQ52695.1 beta-phosphoglucomutase family hydrolase [Streptomyces sp. SID4941]MYY19386.1 beta-phosphoglucomutase family hydrolase [Streptomyces sp. SID4912]SCD61903.1 haloacid dehalogenase superfamily, subfamily IA, variant 3 with third motif having DD or ED/beta-phosphoglucomutase family hydrolase [Streptomyces sp. DpondAA-D4]SCD86798.1 haloacid dehalogenase superfamily, subfamily IA, variant 3 with third motif having DD o
MTTQLGLPEGIQACLFDLDGVVTRTAVVHAAAWKATFDAFLRERDGEDFRPFTDSDYDQYVDGRPRADGVRSFLASRGIELPEGTSDDPPDTQSVNGVGNRKNELLLEKIRTDGVEPYEGTLRYIDAVRAAGLATAIVSSSANTRDVLHSIDAERLFDARIDGVVARERKLPGKPHPDTFLAAARDLGVEPSRAAVFEDALAGMDAGRSGHFGFVVGVDRVGQTDALYAHGADRVVKDLAELGGRA